MAEQISANSDAYGSPITYNTYIFGHRNWQHQLSKHLDSAWIADVASFGGSSVTRLHLSTSVYILNYFQQRLA
jgi:hypothetical protein